MTPETKPPASGPGLPKGLLLVVSGFLLIFFSCLGVFTFKQDNLWVLLPLGGVLGIVGSIVFFVSLSRKR